jgi:hypothetical protein
MALCFDSGLQRRETKTLVVVRRRRFLEAQGMVVVSEQGSLEAQVAPVVPRPRSLETEVLVVVSEQGSLEAQRVLVVPKQGSLETEGVVVDNEPLDLSARATAIDTRRVSLHAQPRSPVATLRRPLAQRERPADKTLRRLPLVLSKEPRSA